MKITILESSVGPGPKQQILASYIVNDSVVIDAGSIGFASPLELQQKVKHVFVSHSHVDHHASLPMFIDNVYAPVPECPIVYGSADVLDVLQKHTFNNRVWPDFIALGARETPFLKLEELKDEVPVKVDGMTITPVALDHVVPVHGFIIDEGDVSVGIVSDTNPTQHVWDLLNQKANLKAVLLECSFPNSFDWLAEIAAHLTPKMFGEEQAKLKDPNVKTLAIHVKTAHDVAVRQELMDLGLPNMEIAEEGKTYEFT